MSLWRHGVGLATAQLLEKVLSFTIILLASRILKTDGIGEFFYYFSMVSLFIPVMDLGLDKLLQQRWFSRDKEARQLLMTQAVVLKLSGGMVGLLLALVVDALVRWGNANPKAILACFVAVFSVNMGELVRRPRFTEQHIGLDLIVPVGSRLLTLVGVIALLHRFVHGYQLAYLYALANLIGLMISFLGIRGNWPVLWRQLNRTDLLALLRCGVPFSLTSLFVMLSLYVDSVMLGRFSLEEVGAYGAAYRVILVVAGLAGSTSRVLFPRIVRLKDAGHLDEAGGMLVRVLRVHLMMFGTMALGGFIMAQPIMVALYGKDFVSSGGPFRILCALIVIVSFTNVIGQTLEAMGRQHQTMGVALLAALFNVVANLLLIPPFGMIGAACTTIATEAIVLTAQLVVLRRIPGLLLPWHQLLRSLLFLVPILMAFLLMPSLADLLEPKVPLATLGTWIALCFGGGSVLLLFLPLRRYWLNGLLGETEVRGV